MKAPRFSYVRPERLDEALRLLAQHGEDARISSALSSMHCGARNRSFSSTSTVSTR